jgi:hypothetical protein
MCRVHHVDEEHDNQGESSKRSTDDHAQLVKGQVTGDILLGICRTLASGQRVDGAAGSTLGERMRRAGNVRLVVVAASKETHCSGVL